MVFTSRSFSRGPLAPSPIRQDEEIRKEDMNELIEAIEDDGKLNEIESEMAKQKVDELGEEDWKKINKVFQTINREIASQKDNSVVREYEPPNRISPKSSTQTTRVPYGEDKSIQGAVEEVNSIIKP